MSDLYDLLFRSSTPAPEYGEASPELAEQMRAGGLTGALLRTTNPMLWDDNSGFAGWAKKPAGSSMGEQTSEELLSAVIGTTTGLGNPTRRLLTELFHTNRVVPRKPLGWTDARIDRELQIARYPDNKTKSYVAFVQPRNFTPATTPGSRGLKEIRDEVKSFDIGRMREETQTPNIIVDMKTPEQQRFPEIVSHEGRHRMEAAANAGYDSAPIIVNTRQAAERQPENYKTFLRQFPEGENLPSTGLLPLTDETAEMLKKFWGNMANVARYVVPSAASSASLADLLSHTTDRKE